MHALEPVRLHYDEAIVCKNVCWLDLALFLTVLLVLAWFIYRYFSSLFRWLLILAVGFLYSLLGEDLRSGHYARIMLVHAVSPLEQSCNSSIYLTHILWPFLAFSWFTDALTRATHFSLCFSILCFFMLIIVLSFQFTHFWCSQRHILIRSFIRWRKDFVQIMQSIMIRI